MKLFKKCYLYFTVFASGAAVLIIEILGTRVIAPFFGSTIFVWTSLITITLGALALGYFAGGRVADRKPNYAVFYLIIFCAGFFTAVIMKIDQPILIATENFGLKFGPLISSLLLFALPLFLLGMVSPFAIRLRANLLDKVGRASGDIFTFSTAGSLAGALLAGFFLVPLLSISKLFLITAAFLAFLSILGFVIHRSSKTAFFVLAIIVFVSLSLIFLKIPKYNYDDKFTLQTILQKQSFYGDLKVVEIGGFRCLAVNGSYQSCVHLGLERPTFTFIAETKRLIEERKAKSMLLLGMGTGNVLHSLPKSLEIDIVEIDSEIVAIAKEYFDFSEEKYNSLTIDDARHYLLKNDKKYDLVLLDTFLGNLPPIHIFTKESFELLKNALNEKGLLLVNLEGKFGAEDKQLKSLIKTARAVFPGVVLTVTEPERYTSVLLHLSLDKNYKFQSGGKFTEVIQDYKDGILLTDNKNPLEIISVPKLALFREEMKKIAGLKIFFAD
ncbi:MAG: fused MFS/spermidine synthase [Candidatus Pacebacteria bacterium]|nr:fused MFS/spermidine synthase [Candidatus Paceibacterota bacterium]